jgi:hypothetical protein
MRNEREFNEMMNSGIPTDKMVAFTGTRRNDKSFLNKIHDKDIFWSFLNVRKLRQKCFGEKWTTLPRFRKRWCRHFCNGQSNGCTSND